MARPCPNGKQSGFTLLELLLVLFIVALLAAIAVPNVQTALVKSREAALAENLMVMRRAIDDYFADRGEYPEDLNALVTERYIRFVPDDPVNPGGGWNATFDDSGQGIEDVRSFSPDTGLNQVPYELW